VLAFLSVAAATFFCLSMIWPISIKAWRSESDVALTLTDRNDASVEFKKLLGEVVHRHTSPEAIANVLDQHGLRVRDGDVASTEVASGIQDRLKVVLINDGPNDERLAVRVGLDGEATEEDDYFVNILATTIARDFMTSPLAGILPTEPIPVEDVESLQNRHTEIEERANALLAQISSNLQESANEFASSDPGGLSLDSDPGENQSELENRLEDLARQRDRLANSEGDSVLELAAIDQLIDDVKIEMDSSGSESANPAFKMVSHTLNSHSSANSVNGLVDSLQTTISDLANVAAEACMAAESASRTEPAFSVMGVQKRPPSPVDAIPGRRELLFLLLASMLFGTIVTLAYKPFAQRGFESVDAVGKTLNLPVIATLESGSRFDEVTGPGLAAEAQSFEMPGSNQIVNICKWILFCGTMLTIGFCLVNADIRDAFLVSPFHGFSEIAWSLKSALGITA
jgi:two-component sensor histidine kinase